MNCWAQPEAMLPPASREAGQRGSTREKLLQDALLTGAEAGGASLLQGRRAIVTVSAWVGVMVL